VAHYSKRQLKTGGLPISKALI